MEIEASGKATISLTEDQRQSLAEQLGVSAENMGDLPDTVDFARFDRPEDDGDEVEGFAFNLARTTSFSSFGGQLSFQFQSPTGVNSLFGDRFSVYPPV